MQIVVNMHVYKGNSRAPKNMFHNPGVWLAFAIYPTREWIGRAPFYKMLDSLIHVVSFSSILGNMSDNFWDSLSKFQVVFWSMWRWLWVLLICWRFLFGSHSRSTVWCVSPQILPIHKTHRGSFGTEKGIWIHMGSWKSAPNDNEYIHPRKLTFWNQQLVAWVDMGRCFSFSKEVFSRFQPLVFWRYIIWTMISHDFGEPSR